ncbi:hypothetical protein BP6252_07010 [Coleophoma cylindrospora]|uniref:Small ribosomal subunit protein mS38 n=1 Tax=Coleophoma cylindrospora TaxID=1849047 RepID=A0A3D8RGA8_9HELO|nr:hypothetical protein BP6252_07010 [Coleophoma cylindrospora]
MFSSSVRRVAFNAPQAPIVSSISSTAPRATASKALSHRSHQRRCSSSKPSNPADGSRGISHGQSVPPGSVQAKSETEETKSTEFSHSKAAEGSKATGDAANGERANAEKKTAPAGEKKSPARSSRRKTAGKPDMKDELFGNLPSVPSTTYINANQISVASFFSLHRPISITTAIPKQVSTEQFESIFKPRSNAKTSDVIGTLMNTIDGLGRRAHDPTNAGDHSKWMSEADPLRVEVSVEPSQNGAVQHLDQAPGIEFPFTQNFLTGKYRPFQPPPPPQPMNTADSLAAGAEAAESLEPQQKTYTAVLTIEESTDLNGEVTYSAHSSPFVENETVIPTRFLDRMRLRQERFEESREQKLKSDDGGMEAISVKRQRKLKMKKHKYKKLMRRTRNLRRRLDRN